VIEKMAGNDPAEKIFCKKTLAFQGLQYIFALIKKHKKCIMKLGKGPKERF